MSGMVTPGPRRTSFEPSILPAAVDNVLRGFEPGARIVASGLKWARSWAMPANLLVLPAVFYSMTSLEGLSEPWSLVAERIGPLDMQTMLLGAVYIANGQLAGRA